MNMREMWHVIPSPAFVRQDVTVSLQQISSDLTVSGDYAKGSECCSGRRRYRSDRRRIQHLTDT